MTTDINTMFDPNDPRLTAYALGELHGDELTEFERLLAESAAARDALGEIRETTGWLRNELTAELPLALSAEQHQRLEQHVTLGTGAKENPLTLTLSPQGRGEGTKPALAGVSSAIAPSLPVVTVAPADLRREQVRHRWAVLAAAAATAALAATVMLWPPSTPLLSRSPSRLSISDQQLAQVDARHRIKGIAADISLEQRQFNEDSSEFEAEHGVRLAAKPREIDRLKYNVNQKTGDLASRESAPATESFKRDATISGLNAPQAEKVPAAPGFEVTRSVPLGWADRDIPFEGRGVGSGPTSKSFGSKPGSTAPDSSKEGWSSNKAGGERGESSGKTSKLFVQQDGDNSPSSGNGKPNKSDGSQPSDGQPDPRSRRAIESLGKEGGNKPGAGQPNSPKGEGVDRYSLSVAKGEKRRETLMVTPRIIIQEEEAELLGLPGSDGSKKPDAGRVHFNESEADFGTEAYAPIVENPFLTPAEQPLSTFSVDVDTASYANVRRFLNQGQLPPADAVRIEELVNYFKYDDPAPVDGQPFRVVAEAAPCPWQREHYVARISLKAREIAKAQRPPTNLVFLLDVSGSMQPDNKLPLVKRAMSLLIEELGERDRVSIVTYAGDAGLKLEPTVGSDQTKIMQAIEALSAGGSTNGAAGIHLAYEQALRHFSKESANRVILCTDGDFNVGVSSDNELVKLIEDQAKSGVFLSIFGFGMGNLKDSKLEKLADKGNGHYGYIDDLNEARKNFNEELMGTLYTVAKDVKLQVEFNPLTVGAYRLIGYENRVMAAEDFNNDAKDAGEIGAGHTVTALYEIVPRGKWNPTPVVDPLKYRAVNDAGGKNASHGNDTPTEKKGEPKANVSPEAADDLFTVKLRYKQPDAAASVRTVDVVVDDIAGKKVVPSRDLLWSASVASFGMQLRHSKHVGTWTMADVLETARGAKGDDTTGRRGEFVELVKATMKLMPSPQSKKSAVGF